MSRYGLVECAYSGMDPTGKDVTLPRARLESGIRKSLSPYSAHCYCTCLLSVACWRRSYSVLETDGVLLPLLRPPRLTSSVRGSFEGQSSWISKQRGEKEGPEIRVILDLVAEWAGRQGPGNNPRRLCGRLQYLVSGGQLGLLLTGFPLGRHRTRGENLHESYCRILRLEVPVGEGGGRGRGGGEQEEKAYDACI